MPSSFTFSDILATASLAIALTNAAWLVMIWLMHRHRW